MGDECPTSGAFERNDRHLRATRPAQQFQAFLDRRNRFDAQAFGRSRELLVLAAPDENGARPRVNDDVAAVLESVIDDDVEVECGGNEPAGTLHDVNARAFEALRNQPAL